MINDDRAIAIEEDSRPQMRVARFERGGAVAAQRIVQEHLPLGT